MKENPPLEILPLCGNQSQSPRLPACNCAYILFWEFGGNFDFRMGIHVIVKWTHFSYLCSFAGSAYNLLPHLFVCSIFFLDIRLFGDWSTSFLGVKCVRLFIVYSLCKQNMKRSNEFYNFHQLCSWNKVDTWDNIHNIKAHFSPGGNIKILKY